MCFIKASLLFYNYVLAVINTLQNFAYTWILEPTEDLTIPRFMVTSWLFDVLQNIQVFFQFQTVNSLALTFTIFNGFMRTLPLRKLE